MVYQVNNLTANMNGWTYSSLYKRLYITSDSTLLYKYGQRIFRPNTIYNQLIELNSNFDKNKNFNNIKFDVKCVCCVCEI